MWLRRWLAWALATSGSSNRAAQRRDHHEGVRIDTATEIRMQLTPYDLLAMRPDGFDLGVIEVQPKRFQRVNGGVASQCHEFLFSLATSTEA